MYIGYLRTKHSLANAYIYISLGWVLAIPEMVRVLGVIPSTYISGGEVLASILTAMTINLVSANKLAVRCTHIITSSIQALVGAALLYALVYGFDIYTGAGYYSLTLVYALTLLVIRKETVIRYENGYSDRRIYTRAINTIRKNTITTVGQCVIAGVIITYISTLVNIPTQSLAIAGISLTVIGSIIELTLWLSITRRPVKTKLMSRINFV